MARGARRYRYESGFISNQVINTGLSRGLTGPAAEPHVSVRALILALGRFEITSKDQTRALEKEWAVYRKKHELDSEGKTPTGDMESCSH